MSTDVRDNPTMNRFEITVDDQVAGVAEYERDGDRVVFIHTEVFEGFKGRGLGGTLARKALDASRAAGHTVLPMCPFIRSYIDRHSEYDDLLADPV